MDDSRSQQGEGREIRVERMVMGALASRQGDGVLSCTSGVSEAAGNLCALMDEVTPREYASFYVLRTPNVPWSTLLHVQGDFMSFSNGVRRYTTRAVYECSDAQLEEAGGYAPLLDVLDGMRVYEKADYAANDKCRTKEVTQEKLSPQEQVLCGCVAYCLTHRRPLWIKLGEDERHYGDELRRSWRLHSLLHVVDRLPVAWRRQVSLAFSVDCCCPGTRALLPQMQLVAFHGAVPDCEETDSKAVVVDWTSEQLHWSDGNLPDMKSWTKEWERLDEAPIVSEPVLPMREAFPTEEEKTEAHPRTWSMMVLAVLVAMLAVLLYFIIR